jgi:glycosyltransferase involved in cell wall biosynthesis
MSRIHILTPAVLHGDAVSNDVLGMRRWFRKHGFQAHVYTSRQHRSLKPKVRPLQEYEQYLENREDVLLYHHSVGWPAGLALYERSRNRRVLKYHNVTPAVYYRSYNKGCIRMCRDGQEATHRLVRTRPELVLADSDFNVRELMAQGAEAAACRTVPPFHRIHELERLPPDETLAAELRERKNLLFVGRMAPNKGQLHLIRTLAYYQRYLNGQAHLHLVGIFLPGLNQYRDELEREVRRHRLHGRVHFAGRVSNRQLKTYYAHASVFVCASEHEGFCVPLAEAMYFGVPIVAYGGSAVAGTLGEAGLVWERPAPALLAESIRLIEERRDVRQALVQRQRERFAAHFAIDAIERRLADALAPILPGTASYA